MYRVEIKTYNGSSSWQNAHDPYGDGANQLQDGKLTLVHEGISDFQFTLLYGHPLFDKILPMQSRVKITDLLIDKVIFVGRILDPTNSMDNSGVISRSYVAESELGILFDTYQRHESFILDGRADEIPRMFLDKVLENHNKQAGYSPRKTFKMNSVTVQEIMGGQIRYLEYGTTYENIMNGLVNRLGGFLSIDYDDYDDYEVRYLNYTPVSAPKESMGIELGKNLQSIEEKQKPSQLITRLVPLGAEYDSVPDAMLKLYKAGVLSSGAWTYWQNHYRDIYWMYQLMINLAKLPYMGNGTNGFRDIDEMIDFLAEAGVMNTPGYWKNKYQEQVGTAKTQLYDLFFYAANMYDMEAEKNTNRSDPRPRVSIEEVNGGQDYLTDDGLIGKYGIIEGTVIWDNETNPGAIKSSGEKWLQNQEVHSSVTLSALELAECGETFNRFEVGKRYTAVHRPLNIDRTYQVTQKVINILESHDSTLTFGDADIRITSIQ